MQTKILRTPQTFSKHLFVKAPSVFCFPVRIRSVRLKYEPSRAQSSPSNPVNGSRRINGKVTKRRDYDAPFQEQWEMLSEYMLNNNMFPTAQNLEEAQAYAEQKKAVLYLARQNPGALAGIPLSSLQRLARVKLAGTYERKVLNAYVRFQSTFSEMQQSENGPASFQDLMRLLLRASELNRLDEPHSIQITDYVQACSEVLSWLLMHLLEPETQDIVTLQHHL